MIYKRFQLKQHREEYRFIRAHLDQVGWRLSDAAADLGIAPTTLRSKIRQLGIETEYNQRNPGRGKRK